MQSLNQSNVGPDTVSTATMEKPMDEEPHPAQTEPEPQEEGSESAAPPGTKTPITPQEDGTPAEEKEAAVQPQTESSDSTGRMEVGSDASKPSSPIKPPPASNASPGGGGQKANKQDKVASNGKKYIPSKKAMIDPLKMDMSKQQILPPTCEYFALCMRQSVLLVGLCLIIVQQAPRNEIEKLQCHISSDHSPQHLNYTVNTHYISLVIQICLFFTCRYECTLAVQWIATDPTAKAF